jgi:hypothetical protein
MYSLEKIMKIFIEVFFMIFQSSMGPRKSRCDIFSNTTQGNFYLIPMWSLATSLSPRLGSLMLIRFWFWPNTLMAFAQVQWERHFID